MTKRRRAGYDISAAAMDSTTAAAVIAVQNKHGIKPRTAANENRYYAARAKERRRVLFARQAGAAPGARQREPKQKRIEGMQDFGNILQNIVHDVTGRRES